MLLFTNGSIVVMNSFDLLPLLIWIRNVYVIIQMIKSFYLKL